MRALKGAWTGQNVAEQSTCAMGVCGTGWRRESLSLRWNCGVPRSRVPEKIGGQADRCATASRVKCDSSMHLACCIAGETVYVGIHLCVSQISKQ